MSMYHAERCERNEEPEHSPDWDSQSRVPLVEQAVIYARNVRNYFAWNTEYTIRQAFRDAYGEMRAQQRAFIEQAESAAGWDPNP